METNLDHPLVKFVFSLKHSPKTDLAKGHINNPDAIILLLHAHGMLGLKELRQLSQAWRGTIILGTYFGPTYGFTAKHFTSGAKYHVGALASGGNRHAPPFFRIIHHAKGQRYKNSLSWQGIIRLNELLAQIEL